MTNSKDILIALAASVAVIAVRVVLAVVGYPLSPFEWIGVVAASIAAGRGLYLMRGPLSLADIGWRAGIWIAAWLAAAICWPAALQPDTSPTATLIYVAAWLWLMELELRIWAGNPDLPQRAFWMPVVATATAISLVSIVRFFSAAHPHVGDVDFFYYLCYARDMVDGQSTSENRFFYFPGVYAFWCSIIRTLGDELGALQWTVLAVLWANGALVAAIVWRSTKRVAWAGFAGLWYLLVVSRFQGITGVTEPLATLPWLVGILLWCGRPFQGSGGWARAIALAVTIGLTVYVKQQAGLLALGVGWFLLNGIRTSADRPRFLQLAVLPLGAVATLLIAVLLQGEGFRPLTYGAGAVTTYASEGGLLTNLYVQFRADPGLGIAGCLCVLATMAYALQGRFNEPRAALVGVLSIAAVATLVQFVSRPYHHYLLLAIPCITIAASVLLARGLERMLLTRARDLAFPLFVLYLCPLLVSVATGPASINPIAITGPRTDSLPRLWHQQSAVATDLAALQQQLALGTPMYVLPPRHNSIYFLLETRSAAPLGYTFQFPEMSDVPWREYDRVVVLRGDGLDPTDQTKWPPAVAQAATDNLQRHGFQKRLQLETMTLWAK